MIIYTIYDKIAHECGPIVALKNDGVAHRFFNNVMTENRVTNLEDYGVMVIGEIETDKGVIHNYVGDKMCPYMLEDSTLYEIKQSPFEENAE